MSKDEEGTRNRVTESINLIKSLIGDYGGRVMNVAGDGILALFGSASQSLKFAVEIQRGFRDDAVWHSEDDPITFRIGINIGEVVDDDTGIQGHDVNIAARIQALARPGGICVSGSVQRVVRDTLGVTMHSMGQQGLKNIPEPVDVFAIDINGHTAAPTVLPLLRSETIEPPTETSVAILPLENVSGDPRDNHVCDGVTGDIISTLSRFRDVFVIARHSAFLFKNQNLPPEQIGGQLGVRYLASGGLQRAGSKIRIRIQLIEAASERVIWSEHYDDALSDIFAFQDDVTDTIAARLAVQISAAEARRVLHENPPDLRAYGLVLRGHHLSFGFRKETNLYARRLFEQATAVDPEYGRSYAGMSRTFNLAWRYRWTDSPEANLDKAVELAKSAIRYDNQDARGFSELGFACLYKKQHDASLAAYERAIQLNPNDADILAEMGDALSYTDQSERAIQLLNRAMRLNPCYPDWYLWYLGEAYFHLRDFEQAIATLQKMSDPSEAHRLLASSYAHLGLMEEARYHARQVMMVHPDFSIEHWREVPPYKHTEQVEVLIEGLQKAGLE